MAEAKRAELRGTDSALDDFDLVLFKMNFGRVPLHSPAFCLLIILELGSR